MTSSLLLFTFSPVQSFIAEARRAADLYTGSQILVALAKAATESLRANGADIIYPASLTDDVPNKIVAKVSWETLETEENPAKKANDALLARWKNIAQEARGNFKFQKDTLFNQIWQTQIENDDYLWEVYWVASILQDRDYKTAYKEAENALVAVKFSRQFSQAQEAGFKDTLGGKRQALRSTTEDGRKYWQAAYNSGKFAPAKLRPGERLDSIGLVKRFRDLETATKAELNPFYGFPSTSSVASADFLEKARSQLKGYKAALEKLGAQVNGFTNIRDDPDFPYDGDLLYRETLTPKRLKDDHGIRYSNGELCKEEDLSVPRSILDELYKAIGMKPSPYYAIIKLDGDDIGKRIRSCKTKEEHERFSQKLSEFAAEVKKLAANPYYHARIIYNGGDDVLAMASLSKAIEFANAMAERFKDTMKEWNATASAGVVITHHLSPLSNALRQVQKAEEKAKEQDGKASVCVTVLRRSGETLQMVSKWNQMGKFPTFVGLFENDELSSKLPYDIAQASFALSKTNKMSGEELKQMDEMSAAEIRRLVKRHSPSKVGDTDKQQRASELFEWAKTMPRQIEELANWLSLARFISQGGRT